jgi:hypothetical protein
MVLGEEEKRKLWGSETETKADLLHPLVDNILQQMNRYCNDDRWGRRIEEQENESYNAATNRR